MYADKCCLKLLTSITFPTTSFSTKSHIIVERVILQVNHTSTCLSDCSRTWTNNHLVHKRTKLAKWLSCVASTHLYNWFEYMFLLGVCLEQGVPWYSGNYRVWIHSETRMWQDKNIQSTSYSFSIRAKFRQNQRANTNLDKQKRGPCYRSI